MAATLTPNDALQYAYEFIKRMPWNRAQVTGSNQVQYQVATDAIDRIWTAAPWRWATGVIAPITLTAGSQSFNLGTTPTDLTRLEKCYINDGNTIRDITPVSIIGTSVTEPGLPQFVAYTPGVTGSITFDCQFPTVATTFKFYGWYKKNAPIITSANAATGGALVMDDDYYWVFREFVLYYAYKYADDSKAGSATSAMDTKGGRQVQYSGQLGIAMAALNEMLMAENVLWNFPYINPDSKMAP